jgi:hypothetical protein
MGWEAEVEPSRSSSESHQKEEGILFLSVNLGLEAAVLELPRINAGGTGVIDPGQITEPLKPFQGILAGRHHLHFRPKPCYPA